MRLRHVLLVPTVLALALLLLGTPDLGHAPPPRPMERSGFDVAPADAFANDTLAPEDVPLTDVLEPAVVDPPVEEPQAGVPGLPGRCEGVAPPMPVGARLELVPVVEGLDRPVQVVSAADGTRRLLLAHQDGHVLLLCDGWLWPIPFLDLRGQVGVGEEAGLLGIALSPQVAEVFAYFVDLGGSLRLVRYPVDPHLHVADATRGETVLRIPTGPGTHYGGTVVFGPDGHLYLSVGDTDEQDNPSNSAQDLGSLQGKILRLDVRDRPYAIPADNPFGSEVWAYGLRNPFRMAFDPTSGDLWIGDVGGSLAEEVDVVRAGESGVNFGWRVWEGAFHRHPGEEAPGAVPPVHAYRPSSGFCAIVGGLVYRGDVYAELEGRYLFADFCHRRLLALDPATGAVGRVTDAPPLLVSMEVDDAGAVYALSRTGLLLRLEPAPDAAGA